jgi:hypothetical protein
MRPRVSSPLAARRERQHLVRIFRKQLEVHSFPRLQMALIVALTGGAGLLSSYLLLAAGWDSMVTRYPVALALAYLVFLLLLWLWLRGNADDYIDAGDPGNLVDLADLGSAPFRGGGGGDFGGGGAEASFDAPGSLVGDTSHEMPSIADAASGLDGVDGDLEVIPLAVIALAIGMALASLYIVWAAPVLFAELLLDGALTYSLYRRLNRPERFHWFETALRRTAWPFVATAVFLGVAGFAMQAHAPEARTLGEVVHHAKPH